MLYSEQINNNPWIALQNVVSDANSWPKFIRKMFWNRNLTDHNRITLANTLKFKISKYSKKYLNI